MFDHELNEKIREAMKAAGMDHNLLVHNNRYMSNDNAVEAVALIVRLKEALNDLAGIHDDQKTARGEVIKDLVDAADTFLKDGDFLYEEGLYETKPHAYSISQREIDMTETRRCDHCGKVLTMFETYDANDEDGNPIGNGAYLCDDCHYAAERIREAKADLAELERDFAASLGKNAPEKAA